MAEIKLTNSDRTAQVDDDIADYINQWSWSLDKKGYAYRREFGLKTGRKIYMHNEAANEYWRQGTPIAGDPRPPFNSLPPSVQNSLSNLFGE